MSNQKNVSVYIGSCNSPLARAVEALARRNNCSESDLFKSLIRDHCEQIGLVDEGGKWKLKMLERLESKFPKKKTKILKKDVLE